MNAQARIKHAYKIGETRCIVEMKIIRDQTKQEKQVKIKFQKIVIDGKTMK